MSTTVITESDGNNVPEDISEEFRLRDFNIATEVLDAYQKAYAAKDEKMMKEFTPIIYDNTIRLVHSIINRRYSTFTSEHEDLESIGITAALEAALNFDASKKAKPITYIFTRVVGAMSVYINKITRNLSKNDVTLSNKINQAVQWLEENGFDSSNPENIAFATEALSEDKKGLTPRQVKNFYNLLHKTNLIYGDAECALDDDSKNPFTIFDTIASPTETPEEAVVKKDLIEAVRKELMKLPENERNVVISIYVNHNTQKDTADDLGLSDEEVTRLFTTATAKLKNSRLRHFSNYHEHNFEKQEYTYGEEFDDAKSTIDACFML
jgi:RNA polymerase sigma factor for flagellar operon FliA